MSQADQDVLRAHDELKPDNDETVDSRHNYISFQYPVRLLGETGRLRVLRNSLLDSSSTSI